MSDVKFLTAEEVSERYRGEITVGTLRNWRAMRIGPAYVKIGKAVLYPVSELDAWDQKNLVVCRTSNLTASRTWARCRLCAWSGATWTSR
jgi:Helix-turn-helix domain